MIKDKIVITKTPLRISFIGGGTDMPYFYEKYEGCTVSCAINKYIYVTVKAHENFDEKYRLNYSSTEVVNNVNEIKNLRIKEILKYFKIKEPLYINTISDLPSNSGLGSSSSFTIGLIKALVELNNYKLNSNQIAELAFKIESKLSENSLGKQDHYIAVYGGLNIIKYKKNKITVDKINLKKKFLQNFQKKIFLLWTGRQRLASNVLIDQKKNFKKNILKLIQIRDLSYVFKKEIIKKNPNIKKIGKIIDTSWKIKQNFSNLITNKHINNLYEKTKKMGSYGGKLLGAGSGGYILIIASEKNKNSIKKNFNKKSILEIAVDESGSVKL